MIEKCDKEILDIMIRDYFKGRYQETNDIISEVKPHITSFIIEQNNEYLKESIDYFLRGINKMDNKNVHITIKDE